MSDIASGGGQTSSTSSTGTSSLNADQVRDAARQATEALGDKARQTAQDLKGEASTLVSQARERAMSFAEERKALGAEQIDGVAGAVARAADDLEEASPQVANYVRGAANGLQRVSSTLRDKSVSEMADMATSFARQQPMLFFGGAVLAGLALSRFLKSSAPPASSFNAPSWQGGGVEQQGVGLPQGTEGEFSGASVSTGGTGITSGSGGSAASFGSDFPAGSGRAHHGNL